MKFTDLLGNISGLAALAIIVLGVFGFGATIIVGALGKQLTPEATALVTQFTNYLIGLAIGSGALGGSLALRMVRSNEALMQSMSHRKDQ
jgi:hypothetical protein